MEQNIIVKNAISNFISIRTDIFGEGSAYKGFKDIKTSVVTDDGFNSIRFFGYIIYEDMQGNIHQSTAIMMKVMPKLTMITKYVSNSFFNELHFYTKIVPLLSTLNESFSSLFPIFYHGEMIFNVKHQSIIIFEDLSSRGYRMSEKKLFLDRDHLILMTRKLGQFHAYSYKAKNDIPELFYPVANHCLETNPCVNKEYQNLLSLIGQPSLKHLLQTHPSYEKYASRIANMLQNADEIYKRAITGDKDDPISVICHGDFLRNNVMFKYDGGVPKDTVFIDLAMYRLASPVIDLITVLYLSTDQSTRDEFWDTLIDEYYTALKTTFPESQVPDKSEILSQFVDRAFYGYLVATYFIPNIVGNGNGNPKPDYDYVVNSENQELGLHEIKAEVHAEILHAGRSDAGTRALSDILKDMIDRGFICK